MFGVIIRATAHEAPGTMALRLRIVSEQRRTLGSRGVVMFGVGGGSIGRAADNDLVLSRRHGEFSSKAFELGTHLCSGSEAACILPVCCLNFGMNNV